ARRSHRPPWPWSQAKRAPELHCRPPSSAVRSPRAPWPGAWGWWCSRTTLPTPWPAGFLPGWPCPETVSSIRSFEDRLGGSGRARFALGHSTRGPLHHQVHERGQRLIQVVVRDHRHAVRKGLTLDVLLHPADVGKRG